MRMAGFSRPDHPLAQPRMTLVGRALPPVREGTNGRSLRETRHSGRPGRAAGWGGELQKHLRQDVPFIPLGEYWQASAYRKRLVDIIPGCFATFYGVRPA
jgi:hypothetical protein